MALIKLTEYGYGQLELNLVAFPRDGRVVAQYKAGTTFTADEVTGDDRYLECGMLLKVDGANRCVDKAGSEGPQPGEIYALNYSTEHMYDERVYRLADFRLNSVNDFYPRLGYLSVGDKFTTNTVIFDDAKGATPKAYCDYLKTVEEGETVPNFVKTPVYGMAHESGYILLTDTIPANGPVLRVIEVYTMPDGQQALKFETIRA